MEFASIYYYGKDHWPVALIDKEADDQNPRCYRRKPAMIKANRSSGVTRMP